MVLPSGIEPDYPPYESGKIAKTFLEAYLVGMVGIEPTTPVLSGLYSTSELHASKIGAPYGIRTHDLRRERALS